MMTASPSRCAADQTRQRLSTATGNNWRPLSAIGDGQLGRLGFSDARDNKAWRFEMATFSRGFLIK
jgi:hypothetical protein